jgi:hypothetical protein
VGEAGSSEAKGAIHFDLGAAIAYSWNDWMSAEEHGD